MASDPIIAISGTSPDVLLAMLLSYPFITSLLWSLSGLYYLLRLPRRLDSHSAARPVASYAVIIPFYGEPAAALASARSLAQITPRPAEIIIVDDGSPTEDIDISWRLQTAGWRLSFESTWIARVEMAPTVAALWRQRRRWSAGLGRALRDHGIMAIASGARHLPIVVLTIFGLTWRIFMLAFLAAAIVIEFLQAEANWRVLPVDPAMLVLAGLAAFYGQLATAMAVDGRNPLAHWRSVLLAPFYPAYFWGILLTSFLAGFPRGALRLDGGTWQRTLRRAEGRESH